MTTLILTNDTQRVDSYPLDISPFWVNSGGVYHTATAAVVDAGIDFLFEGSGFTHFDTHGYPTSGTVTSFTMIIGPTRLSFTDFTLNASQLEHAFKNGDTAQFNQLLLGGDDHITAAPFGSVIAAFGGNDTMRGLSGDDTLYGGSGDDTIRGNGGADVLQGGGGADDLFGGNDADTFVYLSTADSHTGHVDTITGLANEDTIDLSAIDADPIDSGHQHFTIVASFDGTPSELVLSYDAAHHRTAIRGYTDSDAKADLVIYVDGDHHDFTNFDGAS